MILAFMFNSEKENESNEIRIHVEGVKWVTQKETKYARF